VPAWARIHGRNKLKACRKARTVDGARNLDVPGLDGLAQPFECRSLYMWKLVEKEYASMRQCDFAGANGYSTPNEGGDRCRMVGGPKWGPTKRCSRWGKEPCGRINHRHLLRSLGGEVGPDPWEGPSEQGLAHARRAREENRVRPHGRDLEGASGKLLTSDLGEVDPIRSKL
jgi:hypothetical protein